MRRRVAIAVAVMVVALAAAQLVQPDRANPPTDASRTIQAHLGTSSGLAAVLGRACSDCHSNATVWPWYAKIAPVSWLMTYGVKEGREALNFSDWAAYPPERQQKLLEEMCRDVSAGRMPGLPWTLLHPEARLSAQDIQTVCAAAHQAGAGTATHAEGTP